ncbi:MAG TPA: hypothetical protein VK897_23085 [Anaerolineales bacterium]|nr:hypothetical protein [Anaerolineales bacterium]
MRQYPIFTSVILISAFFLAACSPPISISTLSPTPTEPPHLSVTPLEQEQPVISGTPLPLLPLPVREEVTFTITGQVGGTLNAVAMDGNIVYLGVGPRLLTVDITDPAAPRVLWQSQVLSGIVSAIAVQSGLAYVGAGRNFYIYNIVDPSNPVQVSFLNAFDGSEQVSWLEIHLVDHIAYTLSYVNYFSSRLLVALDVRDSKQPVVVGTRELPQGSAVAVGQNALVVAAGGGDFNNSNAGVLQLVDPANLERTIGEIALDNSRSYQVAASGSIVYVVENRLTADPDILLVLDISNPARPREVARQQMMIERSINGVAATDEALILLGHAWPEGICPPLLYFLDITNPAVPGAPVEYDPQSCIGRITLAGDALLASDGKEVQVLDISDPDNLTLTSKFSPPAVLKDVQGIALDQDLAYIHSTAGGAKVQVFDMTGASPVPLSEVSDMGPYYDIGFQGLSVRGNILFMQIQALMIGFDIRQVTAPRLITNELYSWDNWTPPAQAGNILYKTATNGVEIMDVSDVDSPVVVKTIPLDGRIVTALSASEGRLLVFSQNAENSEERQLHIFEVGDPINPIKVGQFRAEFEIVSFTVAGDIVYAAAREGEQYLLYLLDIADPARPAEAGRFALPKAAGGLITSGDLLYMMMTDMSSNEIWALNIGDRSHPYLAGHHPLTYLAGWHYPLSAGDFAIDGDQIYLAAGNAGLYILLVEK